VTGVDTAALADEIAIITGGRFAAEVMRLFEQKPELLLAHLQERGRLQRTKFAYRYGRTGSRYGRQPERDVPPAAVLAADNPNLPVLWMVK
jgi:hypothetical protein